MLPNDLAKLATFQSQVRFILKTHSSSIAVIYTVALTILSDSPKTSKCGAG